MLRLLVAGALFAAAGGCLGEDVPDYRPLELDYLTQQIFAPTCGGAQCHSTFKQSGTNVFDTPEGVRASLVTNLLVRTDPDKFDPDDAKNADLIIWLTETDPFLAGIGRMPYDAPLPNRDVKLLIEWIEHKAPGAQCNPDQFNGKACTLDAAGRTVSATCTADWNIDFTTAIACVNGCGLGECLL
jgi:hypothetical protein